MRHKAYNGISYRVSKDWVNQFRSPDVRVSENAVRNLDATVRLLQESGFSPKKVFGEDVEFDKIKFNEWHPDTCGCHVQYIWHRDHPEAQRVHYPHASRKHCEHHAHLQHDHHAHSVELHRENQHKEHHRHKLAAELGVEVGEVKFDFDEKRTLRLHHPKLASARRVHKEE